MAHPDLQPAPIRPDAHKSLRILAKSIFKQLKGQGYSSRQILSLATELVALVTTEIAKPERPKHG